MQLDSFEAFSRMDRRPIHPTHLSKVLILSLLTAEAFGEVRTFRPLPVWTKFR